MTIILRTYKDADAFYPSGLFRSYVGEELQMHDYETLSTMVGTYNANDTYNVEQGQLLAHGDPRGIRLLKFTYKLNNNETIWADTTKEKFLAALAENQPKIGGDVTVNNVIEVPAAASEIEMNKDWIATMDHTSVIVENIGATGANVDIEKDGHSLAEYAIGTPFDAGMLPLPDEKIYKIDTATNTLHFGEPWYNGQRLFIRSNKNLTITTP